MATTNSRPRSSNCYMFPAVSWRVAFDKVHNHFLEKREILPIWPNWVCLTASLRVERRGMTGCDCVRDRVIACICFGRLVTVLLLYCRNPPPSPLLPSMVFFLSAPWTHITVKHETTTRSDSKYAHFYGEDRAGVTFKLARSHLIATKWFVLTWSIPAVTICNHMNNRIHTITAYFKILISRKILDSFSHKFHYIFCKFTFLLVVIMKSLLYISSQFFNSLQIYHYWKCSV